MICNLVRNADCNRWKRNTIGLSCRFHNHHLLLCKPDNSRHSKEIEKYKKESKVKTGCNNQEIVAVLGHELGHWKLNHVMKNIIIGQVQIFLMFALFAYLSKSRPLYEAFGFTDSQPVLIGLMVVLSYITAPYSAVIGFLMSVLSRHFEFQVTSIQHIVGKIVTIFSLRLMNLRPSWERPRTCSLRWSS